MEKNKVKTKELKINNKKVIALRSAKDDDVNMKTKIHSRQDTNKISRQSRVQTLQNNFSSITSNLIWDGMRYKIKIAASLFVLQF